MNEKSAAAVRNSVRREWEEEGEGEEAKMKEEDEEESLEEV